MPIALPKILVLDTSTISKISGDYWSADHQRRQDARSFLEGLKKTGALVGLTVIQVGELLRHGDEKIARDRLTFLGKLPLIAWVRPCSEIWFPGSVIDVVAREIDLVSRNPDISWPEIVAAVRGELWEHGTGAEMFNENNSLWSLFRSQAIRLERIERYVESVARAQDDWILKWTVGETRAIQSRAGAASKDYWRPLANKMAQQIEQHGDRRFEHSDAAAVDFTRDSYERVERLIAEGGDWISRLVESFGIPAQLIKDKMTVEEIGELAVFSRQLVLFCKHLRPFRQLTLLDVSHTSVPSYFLQRRLEALQRRAERVSGSDAGDRNIAPLTLYADFVNLDAKTSELLRQVRLANQDLADLMGAFGRVSHYRDLLAPN